MAFLSFGERGGKRIKKHQRLLLFSGIDILKDCIIIKNQFNIYGCCILHPQLGHVIMSFS